MAFWAISTPTILRCKKDDSYFSFALSNESNVKTLKNGSSSADMCGLLQPCLSRIWQKDTSFVTEKKEMVQILYTQSVMKTILSKI